MFFIAGGTGFTGKYLIKELAGNGRAARCLARNREKSEICKKPGIEPALGDITDRESLKGKLDGCSIAVHLVGIIEEKGGMTFEKVHVEGTENIIDEAKKAGVKYLFYQSALGTSPVSWSRYYKTKAEAEEIVRTSGIPYVIFRPSLVIGEGDGFTEKLKELIKLSPIVPVPGSGNAKFQPIYVGDWVKCFMTIFSDNPPSPSFSKGRHDSIPRGMGEIYEFGGPEHITYNEILVQLMEAMGINKSLIHLPTGMIKMSLPFSRISEGIGSLLGKKIPSVTLEQLNLLQSDNICDKDSVKKHFGFEPITYRESLQMFIKSSK